MNGKAVWNIDPHLKLQATLGAELNWFTFDDYKAPTTPGFEAGRLRSEERRFAAVRIARQGDSNVHKNLPFHPS